MDASVRFSGSEFWIGSLAVYSSVPVHALKASNYEEFFNRKKYGLTMPELVATFQELLRRNLIYLAQGETRIPKKLHTQATIENAFLSTSRGDPSDYEQTINYGLTSKGGDDWEGFVRPAWDLYVQDCSDYEERHGVLYCANRTRLTRHLKLFHAVFPILPSTTKITKIGKWRPTYWKQLARGYRAEFDFEGMEEPDASMKDVMAHIARTNLLLAGLDLFSRNCLDSFVPW
jgi:hypothetical protein